LICVIDASVNAEAGSLRTSIAQRATHSSHRLPIKRCRPALWRLETASALQNGIKRKRIDAAYRDSAIQKLLRLPIEIDPDTNDYAWTTTLHLADIHQITVYDASYLELALRRGLPLATRDEQLAAAAISAGATLLPTR